MPFGASKVFLACLCLRSLIKATEKQKARGLAYTAHSSTTTRPGDSYCFPSPAHTATWLALPFISRRQEQSFIQRRDVCACCQPAGPQSNQRWPGSTTLVPSLEAGAQRPLPRGQGLGSDLSHSPCPSFHPSYPGHS